MKMLLYIKETLFKYYKLKASVRKCVLNLDLQYIYCMSAYYVAVPLQSCRWCDPN